MINQPRQTPIKIDTNISGESIFKESIQHNNCSTEQLSNNDDINYITNQENSQSM